MGFPFEAGTRKAGKGPGKKRSTQKVCSLIEKKKNPQTCFSASLVTLLNKAVKPFCELQEALSCLLHSFPNVAVQVVLWSHIGDNQASPQLSGAGVGAASAQG